MTTWPAYLKRAIFSGTAGSITSSLALAVMAKIERKGPLQPVNAKSHWLHGEAGAEKRALDGTHTGVGFATHQTATIVWAMIFEAWIGRRRPIAVLPTMRDAAVMSVIAAGVDYIATPKRFTPGWEFVSTKRSMAVVYAAMALGLGLGVLAQDRREARG